MLGKRVDVDRLEQIIVRFEAAAARCENAVNDMRGLYAACEAVLREHPATELSVVVSALGKIGHQFNQDMSAFDQTGKVLATSVERSVNAIAEKTVKAIKERNAVAEQCLQNAEGWRRVAMAEYEKTMEQRIAREIEKA